MKLTLSNKVAFWCIVSYLLTSAIAVFSLPGWGWAVPFFFMLPFSLGWHYLSTVLLDSHFWGGPAGALKLSALRAADIAFYFGVGPLWIWLIVRGIDRFLGGGTRKRVPSP